MPMKAAGIHISVHRARVTGSLVLPSMALGIALIDPHLTADRAETAICVAMLSREHIPRNIDHVGIFIKVLKLCCDADPFSWDCFDAAIALLKTAHPILNGFTPEQAAQLVDQLYEASPKMISSLDSKITHLIVPVSVMLFGMNHTISDVQHMAYDWIVALERFLRGFHDIGCRCALHALDVFVVINQVGENTILLDLASICPGTRALHRAQVSNVAQCSHHHCPQDKHQASWRCRGMPQHYQPIATPDRD